MQNKIDLLSYYLIKVVLFKLINRFSISWKLIYPHLTNGSQTVSIILKLCNKLSKVLKEKLKI